MSENKKGMSVAASVYEWVETFCTALFVVVMIFTFICRFVTVDGQSMEKTFHHGDRLIISNLFYTPKTGDVVVVQDSTEEHFKGPIIKRVIATAGETVDIDPFTWTVTVTDTEGNARVLNETYVNRLDAPMTLLSSESLYYTNAVIMDEYPHTVADGCVFVMGDNRNNSLDSRFVGDIDERKILGKVYVRVLPKPQIGF